MAVSGLPQALLKRIRLTKATPTTFTVPAGHRYYLASGAITYTASAAVATRVVTIYINDGTMERWLSKFDVTASQVLHWQMGILNWAYATSIATGAGETNYPMMAGDVMNVSIAAADAGDAWLCDFDVWDVVV